MARCYSLVLASEASDKALDSAATKLSESYIGAGFVLAMLILTSVIALMARSNAQTRKDFVQQIKDMNAKEKDKSIAYAAEFQEYNRRIDEKDSKIYNLTMEAVKAMTQMSADSQVLVKTVETGFNRLGVGGDRDGQS